MHSSMNNPTNGFIENGKKVPWIVIGLNLQQETNEGGGE